MTKPLVKHKLNQAVLNGKSLDLKRARYFPGSQRSTPVVITQGEIFSEADIKKLDSMPTLERKLKDIGLIKKTKVKGVGVKPRAVLVKHYPPITYPRGYPKDRVVTSKVISKGPLAGTSIAVPNYRFKMQPEFFSEDYNMARRSLANKRPATKAQFSAKNYTYANPGPWGKYGRVLGSAAGGAIAGIPGQLLGEKLGGYAHYIGKIFGSGDYVTSPTSVKSNIFMDGNGQIPQFGNSGTSIRVRHREYLGDIISSATPGAFKIDTYNINPGLYNTFPWLSQVCGATFQQYRINGMVFEFRSMSADALNSTNTALGSVVMATDYDSIDANFTSKSQMEQTEFATSCKPSSCMIHPIECKRNLTSISELYVRGSNVPATADIRLYDLGKFAIASVGMQAASVNLGELWASFDVTLMKSIQQVPGYLIPTAHYELAPTTLATLPIQPLAGSVNSFDTIGLTFTNGLILTFPVNIPINSIWQISYNAQTNAGGAANATAPTVIASNGMNQWYSWFSNNAFGSINPKPSPGTAVQQTSLCFTYKYLGGATPALPPTLTFTASTVPLVTYLGGDLHVTLLNGNLPGRL